MLGGEVANRLSADMDGSGVAGTCCIPPRDGHLTPWVRDDLPSAPVVICARRDVPPSRARPPRAEARTASHNPRLAKSPMGVASGCISTGQNAEGHQITPFWHSAAVLLGYESGVPPT